MPGLDRSATAERFLCDERGATAIEYGLIAAIMAMFLLVSLALLEDPMNVAFQAIADQLDASSTATPID